MLFTSSKKTASYDQVLGDLEKGQWRSLDSRCFLKRMTPNHHELARRFVTLDNFYDSGEVSGDGLELEHSRAHHG